MSTRTRLTELQIGLLEAMKAQRGRVWLRADAVDTFASTHSALQSLARRKLIEPESRKDPGVVSWKITKAGREFLSEQKSSR